MKEGRGENRYIADCFIRRGKKNKKSKREGKSLTDPCPIHPVLRRVGIAI